MKINNLDELIGKRVVVTADAGTVGYLVAQRHINARRIGATGIVTSWVPGHGGDVVFVEHDDKTNDVGVYCHLNELEFYSDEALAFALRKATEVHILQLDRQRLVELIDCQINELNQREFVIR